MKVAFYTPHLCLRGTTVAIHDYAKYNQEILGNESIVFYDENNSFNHETVKQKFEKFCKILPLQGSCNLLSVEKAISTERCDAIYLIKKGYRSDGITPANCKSLVHAISVVPPTEKHGNVWAYASHWLKSACAKNENIPVVPYMVDLPDTSEDLRNLLGIPKNALVLGRSGGVDTWNLPFANAVVEAALQTRNDLYFLFQNTPMNYSHPRIIHLPSTADMLYKTKFINSCDAMIHARHEGESFGLSCAEFSLRNKPIITWSGSYEKSHLEILANKAHLYRTPNEMLSQIINFSRLYDDYNCYANYTPDKIIQVFKREFLNG